MAQIRARVLERIVASVRVSEYQLSEDGKEAWDLVLLHILEEKKKADGVACPSVRPRKCSACLLGRKGSSSVAGAFKRRTLVG